MATLLNAITYARQLAQTDSNGISDTLGIAFGNDALQNITRSLLERDINAAQTAESYATVYSTDTPPGRFAWPSDMFALKTISVNYSDTTQSNYIQADKADPANIQGDLSWDYLRVNQSPLAPLFNNMGDTGEILPTPVSSASIRIFYFETPTEYTATSDTILYPVSLDYRCMGARIAALYATSQGQLDMAETMNREYTKRLEDIIRILAPQSQQPIKPQKLLLTGWNY
jgi:hypothetical protein